MNGGEEIGVLYTGKPAAAERLESESDRLTVDTATGASQALDKRSNGEFDCLVSEYELPDSDGIEILKTVRSSDSDLPFVLYTEQGSEAVASEAISADVTEYLPASEHTEPKAVLATRINEAVKQYWDQQERTETSERLSQFVEQSPLGVIEWNCSFEVININPAGEEILGYPETELLGKSWDTIVPQSEEAEVSRLVEILSEAKGGFHKVNENVRKNGERIVCEWHNRVVTDDDGDVIAVYSQFQDITNRRKRREAIADLHEIVDDLAACSSQQAIYDRTIKAAGQVLNFDQAAIAIEDDGYLEVEAMSEEVPFDVPPSLAVDEGLAGKSYQQDEPYLIDDVSEISAATPQAAEIRSAISVPISGYGVFQVIDGKCGAFDQQDVELAKLLVQHTETALGRLEREQELQQQNERLEQFTSVVSHDLRNPLQVANSWVTLAREECESEYLDKVDEAHKRMDVLIEELLTLAREGDRALETEQIDLGNCSSACWETVDTAEATLSVDVESALIADRNRFRQLLANLFRNAVEHGGSDVTVTVGRLPEGFYVEDDGRGIPPAQREKIFESGHSATEDGTGFGLSIVARVADAHGWDISVTEGATGGARFEITGVEFAER